MPPRAAQLQLPRPTHRPSLLPHARAGRRPRARVTGPAGEMRGRVERLRRRVELPETLVRAPRRPRSGRAARVWAQGLVAGVGSCALAGSRMEKYQVLPQKNNYNLVLLQWAEIGLDNYS